MLLKTNKPLGLATQIFSRLAIGLACLSLVPALSTSLNTQAAPVYTCPAPYTLQANITCTNTTTKSATVLHISQCGTGTPDGNFVTRVVADNLGTPRNLCESVRTETERQTLDIGLNNRYLGYQFCEKIQSRYVIITRFLAGNLNPTVNPCAGDPLYYLNPNTGELPHTEDLFTGRYMHISQCQDIASGQDTIIPRIIVDNNPGLTNNCDSARRQIETPITIEVGYPNIPATISSYTIENSNVGTGSCTNSNTVVQGSTINCNFPLTGSTNGVYTIPAAGLLGGVLKVNGVITNESNYFGPSSACTIAGAVLTCTNIPVGVDATPGNHEVVILEPNVSWYRNKGSVNVTARPVAVTGTEISSINTGNGSCNPTEIRTGDLTSCSYSLTGSSINEYKLPSTPITAKISTVSTNSAPCQIFNNGTINASLICANVPSLGGTIGDQSAKLDLMGETNTAPIKLLAANTGTVISQSNTGAGKCTPGTITVGNLTLCDFALKGAMDNTYLLPLSGIKAKISTASSSSNPCQVSNNGTLQASITCTQVPTSGAIPGNQTAKLDLADETDTNPVTLIASVTTLGTNPQGQLEGKVGSPVTGFISTTSSTYSGPATYNNGANCVIPGVISLGIFTPVQGTLVPMTCPTGTLSNGVLKATGNVDLGSVKSNFAKTELTMDDIKKVNVICNDGKAITVNSTTTCTFELPENKTLPKDLFFGIGDAKPAGTCTIKDKTVTCINIPTGTKTGVQSLNSQMNDGSVFDTGKKVTVNAKVILAKTGNSNAIFLGMISLAATIFSLSFATRLELVRARK